MTGGVPRRRPRFRRLLRTGAAVLICLAALVSGCESGAGAGTQDGGGARDGAGGAGGGRSGKVELSLWARSDQAGFMGDIVDAFNRSQPDVHVDLTLIPAISYVQKLGVAVAGESGPDLASIDLVYVPFFASSGVLADITDRTRGLPGLRKLSRAHLDQGTYRGRRYALPYTGDASVMYYNTELFEKAGLDPDRPPRDWKQFLTAARKIGALGEDTYGYHFSGRCGGCNVFTLSPLIWASGGNLIKGKLGEERPSVGQDPAVARALRLYRTLWREKLMPPQAAADTGAQGVSTFGSGRVGMYPTGAFALAELRKRYPDLKFKVAPIPGRNGGSSSFTGGDDIAITSNSAHKDAAWRFLKWSVRADVQARHFGRAGTVPIRSDVALGSYSRRGPTYATLGRALVHGRTVRSVQENALFNAGTSPWTTMIAKGVFGRSDDSVDRAVADAQSTMANILSRG